MQADRHLHYTLACMSKKREKKDEEEEGKRQKERRNDQQSHSNRVTLQLNWVKDDEYFSHFQVTL